jgi:hypothetical protein
MIRVIRVPLLVAALLLQVTQVFKQAHITENWLNTSGINFTILGIMAFIVSITS